MRNNTTSAATVFSTMMAAVVFGLALGLPIGFAARYLSATPSNPAIALQNNQ